MRDPPPPRRRLGARRVTLTDATSKNCYGRERGVTRNGQLCRPAESLFPSCLVALEELERALGRVPEAFSGQQKSAKGPAPRNWYSRFLRDLAEIANELGIEVTIGVYGSDDLHASLFTRFVFAVEERLPRKAQSNSLAACAKQIERANKASAHEIDIERAFKAHARKIAESEYKALFARLAKRQRKPSKPAERSRDK